MHEYIKMDELPVKKLFLNDEQKHIADVLRQVFKADAFDQIPLAYSLSEAMAVLIDGINHASSPNLLGPVVQTFWACYLQLALSEQRNNIGMIVGDQERAIALESHPEAKKILTEIFNRTGPILPGDEIPEIDIDDLVDQYKF